jgi:hypothetical protein
LVLPHGSISPANSARIISGWTHGNIYLRLEEGKSRVLNQWPECLVQMPLSWAHWLGLCSCLEWLARICDGFCWRLWFPKCLLSFTGLGFASLKPRASMILLDFLKNDTDKRQFRTDKPKHTYNIFHLEQNQRKLTLNKKSRRCERWAKSSFYRSSLRKATQSCPLAQNSGLLERFLHPAHAGIKRKTVKRYKRALPKVSPRQA